MTKEKLYEISCSENRAHFGAVRIKAKSKEEAEAKFFSGNYEGEISWGGIGDYIESSLEISDMEEIKDA